MSASDPSIFQLQFQKYSRMSSWHVLLGPCSAQMPFSSCKYSMFQLTLISVHLVWSSLYLVSLTFLALLGPCSAQMPFSSCKYSMFQLTLISVHLVWRSLYLASITFLVLKCSSEKVVTKKSIVISVQSHSYKHVVLYYKIAILKGQHTRTINKT